MFRRSMLITFCLLHSIPVITMADLGLADVQAICRVELKDGSVIEGVVLVAKGGYNRDYDLNGFYISIYVETSNFLAAPCTIDKEVLFDLNFFAIRPYKGIREYRIPVEGKPPYQQKFGMWFFEGEPDVFYLNDVTQKYYFYNQIEIKTETDTSSSPTIVRRDFIEHTVVELLNYIPIYPKVPDELYLRRGITSVKPIHVDIEKLERFELVVDPSQKWLDEITSVVKAFKESHDMFEVLLPAWWHDIIKQKERHKEVFKEWRF